MKDELFLPTNLDDLEDGVLYRFKQLSFLLKELGLPYSRFTIRGLETWRCANYECGHRNTEATEKCKNCGSPVEDPKIVSPRIRSGHRRYSKEEIKTIVDVLSNREHD